MEKERLYGGPIPEPFHKKREKLRSDMYKALWLPEDQMSQYYRLDNEIEEIEQRGIDSMGGLAKAKELADKADKSKRTL